ncbi:MAG TPA: CCA tRNA nucleotidyltransferase [Ignavibacteria bacterium]|nr:CCA tRNA nucleotidyltransferase [Ignavibacteria bacterium]
MKKKHENIVFKNELIFKLTEYALQSNTDAYIVGGFIRDSLLGLELKGLDLDVMVIGDAVKFAEGFAKVCKSKLAAVYKKFGTALLNIDGNKIEFASSRKESYTRDSRKPAVSKGTLEEDLSRRDFTINALAVSLGKPDEVIDLFGGINDIKKKIIKTPLDPDKTFFDDPLRILRAIRFASKLDFGIEEKTFDAICENRERLKEDVVSQERITTEFLKILESPKPSVGLNLMYLTGIMDIVFPEMSKTAGVEQRSDYHHKDVFYHTLEVVDNISQSTDNVWLRFAALTHDIAKPKTKKFIEGTGWTFHGHEELGARMMKKIFERMRLPFDRINYVEKLIRLHLRPAALANQDATDSAIRRLAAEAGEELEDLLKLCRADITSKNLAKVRKYMSNFSFVEKRILEVQEKDNLRNFQSPVRGDEIMKICGLEPSKPVGILKTKIEEAILDGIIPNTYDAALEYLYKIKDETIAGLKEKDTKESF